MIIKNMEDIGTSDLREKALKIVEAGIESVLPSNIMKTAVKYDSSSRILTISGDEYNISEEAIFVIGGGKASGMMAETLEAIVGPENILAGMVNCKSSGYRTKSINVIKAGHPIPDQSGVSSVREMLAFREAYSISQNNLVVCLISGGCSALMTLPVDAISLEDMQSITKLLIQSPATINDINIVRKHLSQVKGGRLGRHYQPATVASLIISDVIGNDIGSIASGPTSPDPSYFSDAYRVLERYSLLEKAPKSVLNFLEKGRKSKVPETPKSLQNCSNYVIGDNQLALESMAEKARLMEFNPYVIKDQTGDVSETAKLIANKIISNKYSGYDVIIIGGELTSTLPINPGKGGRSQRYAVESMLAMQGFPGNWVVASAGTDGSDFMPDVDGAIVDNTSMQNLRTVDVQDHLNRFDTYSLLKKMGNSHIVTGNTGTNVCDVMVHMLKR